MRVSRLPVGSSASTIAGELTSARAIATRWRSPPDSSAEVCRIRWPSPTRASAAAAARRRSRAGVPVYEQAVGDVLECAVGLDQVELLEDEADATRPERRQVALGGAGDVSPGDPHEPSGRPFQGSHDVQQRRLARARRADDRAQLAVLHRQVDAAQRLHTTVVALDDVGQLQDGAHWDSITVRPSRRATPSTWT